jgi:hypothetical protein
MGDMAGVAGALMMVIVVVAAYLIEIQSKYTKLSEAEIKDAEKHGILLGRVQLAGASLLCVLALVFVTYLESIFVFREAGTPAIAMAFLVGVVVIDGARFFLPKSLVGGARTYTVRVLFGRILVMFCILTSMAITAAYAAKYVYPDSAYTSPAPGFRSLQEIDRDIDRRSRRINKDIWYNSDACADETWRECVPVNTLRAERNRTVAAQNNPAHRTTSAPLDAPASDGLVRAVLFGALAWLAILISTLLPVVIQQAWINTAAEEKALLNKG